MTPKQQKRVGGKDELLSRLAAFACGTLFLILFLLAVVLAFFNASATTNVLQNMKYGLYICATLGLLIMAVIILRMSYNPKFDPAPPRE